MDFYFSFHGYHSYPYSLHAKGNLENMVKEAIKKGFKHLGITEHMPRKNIKNFYPEELEASLNSKKLLENFKKYIKKANNLKEKYKNELEILIGMETEITDINEVVSLKSRFNLDYIVGSLHHTNGIPIDFDIENYQEAIKKSGSEKKLWEDYFKEQKYLLEVLKPEIVGHLDLIRLYSSKNYTNECMRYIEINLNLIKEYGGIIDINTRAYKKGFNYPYPGPEILKKILEMNIPITLGDDSHDISDIGFEFDHVIEYLKNLGFKNLIYLSKQNNLIKHNYLLI